MNARALIELKKALNYITIGMCMGICITISIHFFVTQVMEKNQAAEREKMTQAVYDKLMKSLPEPIIYRKEVK